MAPPSPSLYRLVSEGWRRGDVLLSHVKEHPEDLVWADRYGNTALHKICMRQLPRDYAGNLVEAMISKQPREHYAGDLVDAMIAIRPELVATCNEMGWTPLHYCVEKRLVLQSDPTLVGMALSMIRACPLAVNVVTQSGFKRMTPFHVACEANADIRILRAMLQVDASLATRSCMADANGKSPVQVLWDAKGRHAKDIMEKMALLLLTTFKGHVILEDPLPMEHILHAACQQRCPRDYLSRLFEEYPTHASQPDERGNLPLHYAVAHASVESQAYTKFVLEELLKLYPQAAAIQDNTGRLPLHVALTGDSRLTWHKGGIDLLVASNPEALYTLDETDRLYPVLTSALHATNSRLHLSTTYELLLAAPGVVRHALLDNDDADREP